MEYPRILDVSAYRAVYGLDHIALMVRLDLEPGINLDEPGLMLHGSEADPLTILKYGLVPTKTSKATDEDWQICIGLSSCSPSLLNDMSRKNSAIQYSGNLSKDGCVYVISPKVKMMPGYTEYWDCGEDARGYAWVKEPIKPDFILALITKNIVRAAAAMMSSGRFVPVFDNKGVCYRISELG